MSRTSRRSLAVAVARLLRWGVVAVVATATVSGVARAAPLSDCSPHSGTVVAVDFAHWGGPLVRGCGLDQRSGYALLHAAGFTTAGDEHDGAGFMCRLGDSAFHHGTQYPTASEDACINTPSASDYWSYWLAPAGQDSWTYSSLGPMYDVPKPGEVELWTFGGTNVGGTGGSGVPSFSPDSLRAHTSAASEQTTTTTTTATTPVSTTTTTHTTTTSSATTRTSRHAPPRRHHRDATRRRRHRPSRSSLPSTSTTPIVPAKPTRERALSGSALPLIIGVCLAAALLGGAGWVARRRRRYE
jgi:LPXTG-motif cell wall-anchored protein